MSVKIPVYLFTGFLEGGKTTLIQESLADKRFNTGEKTLVIMCEEGEVELEPEKFWGQNVKLKVIDDVDDLTLENLSAMVKGKKIDRIIVEYNGMWLLQKFYEAMPSDWAIYQNVTICDAKSFISYNANMRQLTYDKIRDSEMVVLNRTTDDIDKDAVHKIIRGISRRANIVYDYLDGHIEYDDIEDPMPFDLNAERIEIADGDYAVWYRDLSENMMAYDGKKVKFKGLVAKNSKASANVMLGGRHVMTCCADDIQYCGLACEFKNPPALDTGDWAVIEGEIKVEKHKLYRVAGPVVYVSSYSLTSAPKQEVATF